MIPRRCDANITRSLLTALISLLCLCNFAHVQASDLHGDSKDFSIPDMGISFQIPVDFVASGEEQQYQFASPDGSAYLSFKQEQYAKDGGQYEDAASLAIQLSEAMKSAYGAHDILIQRIESQGLQGIRLTFAWEIDGSTLRQNETVLEGPDAMYSFGLLASPSAFPRYEEALNTMITSLALENPESKTPPPPPFSFDLPVDWKAYYEEGRWLWSNMDTAENPAFIIHTAISAERLHGLNTIQFAKALQLERKQNKESDVESVSDLFPMNNPFHKGYAWAYTLKSESGEPRIEMSFIIQHQNAVEYFRLNFPDEDFPKIDTVIRQFEASFHFTDLEPAPSGK